MTANQQFTRGLLYCIFLLFIILSIMLALSELLTVSESMSALDLLVNTSYLSSMKFIILIDMILEPIFQLVKDYYKEMILAFILSNYKLLYILATRKLELGMSMLLKSDAVKYSFFLSIKVLEFFAYTLFVMCFMQDIYEIHHGKVDYSCLPYGNGSYFLFKNITLFTILFLCSKLLNKQYSITIRHLHS